LFTIRPIIAAVTLFLIAQANILWAAATPTPQYSDWTAVAQADVVVEARLSVPVNQIRNEIASKKYGYLSIKLDASKCLKGDSQSILDFEYYPDPTETWNQPSPEAVIALDGQRVLVFLVRAIDAENDRSELFLVDQSSLVPFRESVARQVSRDSYRPGPCGQSRAGVGLERGVQRPVRGNHTSQGTAPQSAAACGTFILGSIARSSEHVEKANAELPFFKRSVGETRRRSQLLVVTSLMLWQI
jgi:hypothetical protein